MDREKPNTGIPVTFCQLLTIAFIVLKLAHVINWSWIWVLAPLWIELIVVIIAIIILIIIYIKKDETIFSKKGKHSI